MPNKSARLEGMGIIGAPNVDFSEDDSEEEPDEELLGDLHDESYIYVQDVRAAAYGYGGKTQEYRYQHG